MTSRAALFAAIGLSLAMLDGTTPTVAQDQPIYGSQLMTQQERNAYRQRLSAATSEQEREQIRSEHRAQMQERAKARGVTSPDEPRRMGAGRSSGGGRRR